MSDIQFIDGLIVKAPRDGGPDFVKASLSIKREDLVDWLNDQESDWINADIKVARSGKWYVAVNDWKPEGGERSGGGTPRGNDRGSNEYGNRPAPSAPSGNDGFDDDSDIPFN